MDVSCLCLEDAEFSSVCDMFEDVDHDIMSSDEGDPLVGSGSLFTEGLY